jgi:hypothetical protein
LRTLGNIRRNGTRVPISIPPIPEFPTAHSGTDPASQLGVIRL